MKKTIKMLFAAAFAIVSAACAREEIFENEQTRGESRTFTCAIDEDAQTRTEITKQGKTVWKEGDKILVSNGTESDTLAVDSKFAGQKYFEFTTTLQGKIYVVYPYNSVKEIKDGKFTLEIPEVQNGEFGSANIACAIAEDRYVKMKNVTAVLKFRVPKEVTTPVTSVVINSVDGNVAGQFNVDLTSGTPVIETPAENTYTTSVTVKTDGNNGNNFYATVIPGTYKAGFTMSAVTLDINKAIENKTTVSDKELKVNAYYDLGNIGTNLQPLGGDGSAAKPYLINNYAEFLMFTNYVNSGKTMRGQSVKLMNDIKGVETPVGSIKFEKGVVGVGNEIAKGNIPFQGEFDGNGKTVTVNLSVNNVEEAVALFPNVADSAYIHDLTVAGNVTSTYKHAAGLVGFLRVHGNYDGKTSIRIVNCKNTANVSGYNYNGGIAAWVDIYKDAQKNTNAILFENCSNEGNVTGKTDQNGGLIGHFEYATVKNCSNKGDVKGTIDIGGIVGLARPGTILDCTNSGNITATAEAKTKTTNFYTGSKFCDHAGAAGIVSFAQNITLKRCSNSGTISGQNKTGGIAGCAYWSSVYSSKNSGKVSGTVEAVGGIVGWALIQARIHDCLNTGEITNAKWQAAGIVGQAQTGYYDQKQVKDIIISNCTNEGNATAGSNGAAGILGYATPGDAINNITVIGCENSEKSTITSAQYVGGIVGALSKIGSGWAKIFIQNCENHGHIVGTTKGQKNNTFIGGILGGFLSQINSQGIFLANCINTGVIEYADPASLYPNAGGIVGRLWCPGPGGTGVHNCYNSGAVRPVTGSPIAGALYGAIVGYVQQGGNTNAKISHSYYLESSCDQITGKDSKYNNEGNISVVDAAGILASPANINGNTYSNIVDALNAWRNGNLTYYSWTAGPKFVYPSYADFGSGDYDLGNGGQI